MDPETQYESISQLTPAELEDAARGAFLRYPLRWAYVRQHILGGKLDPEFRRICKRLFMVHLKKYILGMSDRFWLTRGMIAGVKKMLGKS